MPIGNAYATGSIISFIENNHIANERLNILDVGCGIGHNGFIFREMFEIRYMRLKPEDWMHRIEAIEVFAPYKNPVWDYVYNMVWVSDCLKGVQFLRDGYYDIIFATELLEHLKKEAIYFLLDKLLEKLRKNGSIVITIPVGDKSEIMRQKTVFGNPYEAHQTYLTIKDFKKYNIRHKVNDGIFMIGSSK